MFYTKNLPNWERFLRIAMGLIGLGYAIANWGVSGPAVGIGIMGAMLSMSGMMGFCPMCAMAGRKLNKGH